MPLRVTDGIDITPKPPSASILRVSPEGILSDRSGLVTEALALKASGKRLQSLRRSEQRKDQWCWAACTEMVLHYYDNPSTRQCDIANDFLQRNDCCGTSSDEACDQGCLETDIVPIYDDFDIDAVFHRRRINFRDIVSEINSGRPVEVCFEWFQGGFHVVIISGWRKDGQAGVLWVNDPLRYYGAGEVYFSDLKTARGEGRWVFTWTDIDTR